MKLTNLQSLDESRQTTAMRFAKNCLKNENFSKIFPLNNIRHGMKVRDPLTLKSSAGSPLAVEKGPRSIAPLRAKLWPFKEGNH